MRSKTGRCQKCATIHFNKTKPKKRAHNYKGPFNYWVRKSKGHKLGSTITEDDLRCQWNVQGGRCALTGVDIFFEKRVNGAGSASLDRINSKEGYHPWNIQWVLNEVNIMKNKYEQNHFISMCNYVSQWIGDYRGPREYEPSKYFTYIPPGETYQIDERKQT